MKKALSQFFRSYFSPALDLRVRLFNVLAIGGVIVSLVMAILGLISEVGVMNIVTNVIGTVLSLALLIYSRRSGRYQVCYTITIAAIFMGLFPVLFFSSGGYFSGMPAFFVFAVVFTVFMLEGKKAIFFSVAELALYSAICMIAYYRPEYVNFFSTEEDMLIDIMTAFVIVSVVLGVSMYLHFRLYNEQQRKLDDQNSMLSQVNRAKTEFLANTSHEMRTPLTVISVNVQTVMDILEDVGESVMDPEAAELLTDAQSEIMRLARMVGGMLNLASISENSEKVRTDFTELLRSAADMLWLLLQKRGNELVVEVSEGLVVFGDTDLLSQVIVNLIQNAHAHTENDTIRLLAVRDGGMITVTIGDCGSGIPEDLLPHVFERGVSDGSGTGFGLPLCKTIVESHGGVISMESERGKGTAARFSLPVYEGQ